MSFSDTVEEDLTRRDFTINAVAWHPLTREVRDPHGGREDLRRGVLRTVGEPSERFREDRLRVLRALRFAGRFGLAVDPATWEAARAVAPQLPMLSPERVREELLKLLREVERPSASLRLYRECGALASLYPELEGCVGVPDGAGGDVWSHLLGTVDRVPRGRTPLRLAGLLHDVGRPPAGPGEDGAPAPRRGRRRRRARAAAPHPLLQRGDRHRHPPGRRARRLPRGGRATAGVAPLAAPRGPGARPRPAAPAHRLLPRPRRGLPRPRGLRPGAPPAARRVMRERAAVDVGDLAIGGAELRGLGLPAGPLYGEVLKWLLEEVTDDPELNERETLLGMVRERIG